MTTWNVVAGDPIQYIMDYSVKAGDVVDFAAGTYTLPKNRMESLIYIEKSGVVLNLNANTIIQAAAGVTPLLPEPEISFGVYAQGSGLDDVTMRFGGGGYTYNQQLNLIVTIAGNGTPDTFNVSGAATATGVAITGDWQALGYSDMEIKFAGTTGHTIGDAWYVYPSTAQCHGIRIGRGFHSDYIDGVEIIGGKVDMQMPGVNLRPHDSAREISGAIFYHGRVRGLKIRGTKLDNFCRSIMGYGEHSGVYGSYGVRGPGVSYDAEDTEITGIEDVSVFSKLLFGHPAHRGSNRRISVNGCNISSFEPNFRQFMFEAHRNSARAAVSTQWFHSWRGPKMNLFEDNVYTNASVISDTTPTLWPSAVASRRRNNTQASALPLRPFVDTFPAGWTQRAALTVPGGLFSVAPGKFMLPVFDSALIAAIAASAGGADLRASSDLSGSLQIPVERVTNDSGALVGVVLGVTVNEIGGNTTVYLWWGKSGEAAPPRANRSIGGWAALPNNTVVYLPGDYSTNTIAAGRVTATGAKLGSAMTFSGSQSETFEHAFDDDTRQMAGMYFGAWHTPSTGGTLWCYGSASLRATNNLARATFSNVRLEAAISGATNHIAYRWTPNLLQLLVNGVVVASSALDPIKQHTQDTLIRVAGGRVLADYTGTLDDIVMCRSAPSVASIAAYVAVANNQAFLSLSAPVTL